MFASRDGIKLQHWEVMYSTEKASRKFNRPGGLKVYQNGKFQWVPPGIEKPPFVIRIPKPMIYLAFETATHPSPFFRRSRPVRNYLFIFITCLRRNIKWITDGRTLGRLHYYYHYCYGLFYNGAIKHLWGEGFKAHSVTKKQCFLNLRRAVPRLI